MRLKQATIAKELGITEGRVSQMKRQGMPVDNLDKARAWYAENVDLKFSPKPPDANPGSGKRHAEENAATFADLQKARAKREFHEANLAELKERQALGELVEADRVRRAVTALAAMVRSAFERIPDKLADRLAATADPMACHALLTTEIDQVLADLSAGASSLQLVADDGRG